MGRIKKTNKQKKGYMKIAFTSLGKDWESIIDPRFGRADYIVVFDEELETLEVVDNSSVKDEVHGAGTATAQKVFAICPDVLITGNGPGGNAASALKQMNMKIYVNAHSLSLREAYIHYKNGKLNELL
jgi:predicted Fe-Mo cluster-binding NifX family protein